MASGASALVEDRVCVASGASALVKSYIKDST